MGTKEEIKQTFIKVGKEQFDYSQEADNLYTEDEINKICENIEYIYNNPDYTFNISSSEVIDNEEPGKLYLNGTIYYNVKNNEKIYFSTTFIYKYVHLEIIKDTKERDGKYINYTIQPGHNCSSLLMGNNRENIYSIIINAYDKDFFTNLCKLVHKEYEKLNYIKKRDKLFIPDYKAINKDYPYFFDEGLNDYLNKLSEDLKNNNYKNLIQDDNYIYIPDFKYGARGFY